MPTVKIPNNFTPRDYQRRAMGFFDAGGRMAFTVWHRRAGKDLTAAHQTCKMALQTVGNYWHFFPTLAHGKRAIWKGHRKDGIRLLENVFPGFTNPKAAGSIVRRVNETECAVELKNGSMWQLMGSDRAENVGAGPKGIVFSEYALCRPTVWDLCRPMLRESEGWAWFITTPRGRNHAWKLFDLARREGSGWYSDVRTVYDTGLTYASDAHPGRYLTPDEMMAEEEATGMEPDLIRQEYLCDWAAALVGSVWGALLESLSARGGICEFASTGFHDVCVSQDIGVDDSTAQWYWRPRYDAQGNSEGVDILDRYANHGLPFSHYADEIDKRAQRYGWQCARIYFPHDAKARTFVTGSSTLEEAMKRWPGRVHVTPSLSLADGIQAGRRLLQGATRFHSRCEGEGLEALRHYHYAYDEARKIYGHAPEHDWSSHDADAFRYVAVSAEEVKQALRPAQPVHRPADGGMTLGDMWSKQAREAPGRRRL